MKILIHGKKVWPPPDPTGLHLYTFEKGEDGSVVYTELPSDGKGGADRKHPTVVLEIDRKEVQRLLHLLSLDKSPDDPKARAVIEGAMRGLERIRKETESPGAD